MANATKRLLSVVSTTFLLTSSLFAQPNLRDQFFESLASEKAVGAYDLDVTSRSSGALILSGTVTSNESRDRVEQVARELPGVTSVDNNIAVAPSYQATINPELRNKLLAILLDFKNRGELGRSHVEITSNNGKLILSGTVQDQSTSHAIERSVRAALGNQTLRNELTILTPSDEEITARVRRALELESDTDLSNLAIVTQNGVVTLSGHQPDHRLRDKLLSLTLNTDGVKSIRSELR